mgnify:CR=1 FL=1
MTSRWVVFDAMGVIFEVGDDVGELLVPFVLEHNPAASVSTIQTLYHQASSGKIPAKRFWSDLGLGREYPAIEQEYLRTRLRLDPTFVDFARRLHRDYRLGLLSNDVAEWSAQLRAMRGLDELFDAILISGEAGVRKPCEGIYQMFLSRARTSPEDCALIDDSDQNLDMASRLGFRTIRFSRESGRGPCRCSKCVASFDELPPTLEDVFLDD